MISAHVSDRNYSRLRRIESLVELADYTLVTVDGKRVDGKVAIPEFVTFKRFPESSRTSFLECVEPVKTVRMKFSDYEILRDAYNASQAKDGSVRALVQMAESYL